MFWEYMLRGLCIGGWVIGLLTALAAFFLLLWGLIHLGVIAAGGKEEKE